MQIVLTIAIIGVALVYLGYQFYKRFIAKETKCDGCAVGKIANQEK